MGIDNRFKKRGLKDKPITENMADFLWDMYKESPESITYEQKKSLIDYGKIGETDVSFDDFVDVRDEKQFPSDVNLSSDAKGFNFGKVPGEYRKSKRTVTSDMWRPKSLMKHTDEFFHWINSMMFDGFQQKLPYEPLQIYIEQAHNWLSDDDNINNYYSEEDKLEYAFKEIERCRENSLYWLDKYVKLFESDMLDSSSMDYISKPVHEVMAFMFDCGYNQIVGKPRQIAATTTYLALASKRLIFFKNTFVKFITMDVDSAEEILEQKMKFPISELPDWLRPSVSSDSAKGIKFGRKIQGKKGVRGGVNSKFHVVAPSVSAVNGGAPSLVLVDEAAYIRMLIKMIMEARPTMFRQNPKTNEIEMLRQVIIWGTGGVSENETKAKAKAYEELFNIVVDKWSNRDEKYGIVPIFFDWTTRPGVNQKFYDDELKNYTIDGPEKEALMNQFRLTYPSKLEDMFLDSAKTLVPISFIEEREKAFRDLPHIIRPQYGYFEPEYDMSKPTDDGNELPYKVSGAKWIPVEDEYDRRASAVIFKHPDSNWEDRYYNGVDPIAQDNGYSNMASAIFDAKMNTISAVVNYRDDDHKNTYLQNMLLGVYYGSRGGMCKTLIEANIGTSYADYLESKGFYNAIVRKSEVLAILQGGQNTFGVDNRGARNGSIITKGYELVYNFGDRIYIPDLWKQLRTFICTTTNKGTQVWGTSDYKKYHDDVFFGCTFAYICRESFAYLNPRDVSISGGNFKIKNVLVRNSDGKLSTRQTRVRR